MKKEKIVALFLFLAFGKASITLTLIMLAKHDIEHTIYARNISNTFRIDYNGFGLSKTYGLYVTYKVSDVTDCSWALWRLVPWRTVEFEK